jgi:uncharacterized protein (DUF3820 family)
MRDMSILKFGKFKGKKFTETPVWYQQWLLKQDWFNTPNTDTISGLSQKLTGWDGHSKRGEAIYDRIFELEKVEGDKMYCDCGNMKSPNEKYCGYGCIAEC